MGLFGGFEGAWGLSAHRCGIWLVGTSSFGKGNVLAVHKLITNRVEKEIRRTYPELTFPCFNDLNVGRLTYSGLLAQLDEGASHNNEYHWLSWINSEIKQCFGKGARDIQERDSCQLAEAVDIGKRIENELVSKTPHFHFIIGAQKDALPQVFGDVSNGRARGFCVPIEKARVMDLSMADKLAAQHHSMAMLVDSQMAVVECQHASDAPVKVVKHSAATFTVVNAMHEAMREVVSDIGDDAANQQDAVARALWPGFIKLIGKATCSPTVANLFCRNGI